MHMWANFKHILEIEKCTLFQQLSQCGYSSQLSEERREKLLCSNYLLDQYLPDYVKYQPSKGTVCLTIEFSSSILLCQSFFFSVIEPNKR